MKDRSRKKRRDISRKGRTSRSDRVVATVMVTDSPVVIKCLSQLPKICDRIYVLFDCKNGSPELLRELRNNARKIFGGKLKKIVKHRKTWEQGIWHEWCLRILDDERPEIVVTVGHDEVLQVNKFKADLERLRRGDQPSLMLDYGTMPTDDGRKIPYIYPVAAHMKAFRWEPGLSYVPYNGRGQVWQYASPAWQFVGKSKVMHYCMWTKGMQAEKEQWIRSNYNFDKVTGKI